MIFRNTFLGVKSAVKNLWRNRMMSFASITSVIATLMILGLIFIIIMNINNLVDGLKDQYEEITVYLSDTLDEEERVFMISDISGITGVADVRYISKEEAMLDWRETWGENAYLLDGLDENPLPNAMVITLGDLEHGDGVADIIKGLKGIEDVKYQHGLIENIINASRFVRTAGFVIIVILLAITTFIIGNTIKLAVFSRRTEINIMKYVGATNWFIRRPFLIEGAFLGLIGALIATSLIYLLYRYVYQQLTTSYFVLLSSYLVKVDRVTEDLLVIFIVLGVGIGILGSINAMRRHLNV